MSNEQKHDSFKNTVKNIVMDQLLASEPASLSLQTILKGVQCSFADYSQKELLSLLNNMSENRELLKIVDAESGARFKLISFQNSNFDEEDF